MANDLGKKKTTVVFVERVPWGGGAERVVLDIARHLDRERFKPIIVCLYKGEKPPGSLYRGIPCINLVPMSLAQLFKATLTGRLGTEYLREWKTFLIQNTRLGVVKSIRMSILWKGRAANGLRKFLDACFKREGSTKRALDFGAMAEQERVINVSSTLELVLKYYPRMSRFIAHLFLLTYRHRKLSSFVKRILGGQAEVIAGVCEWISSMAEKGEKLCEGAPLRSYAQECAQKMGASSEEHAPITDEKVSEYLASRSMDMNRQARLLASFVETLRGPVVVVPQMEEAAAVVRLGLGARPNAVRPYIVQTHAWESYYLPIMYGDPCFDIRIERHLFVSGCQGAEVVTSPSVGCRDDLVEMLDSLDETTITLPNPVDLDSIRTLAEKEPEVALPQEFANKTILICVARLAPQKRHKLLFEACSLLKERDDFVLLCLGNGPYEETLKKSVVEMGLENHVHFFGYVRNPYPYMRLAKGLVSASESESFGLVLIEALACGCLPISTDCPHGPRDVLDGGRIGLLVEDNNVPQLAKAMGRALDDEVMVRGKLAHGNEWIKQYSIDEIIKQWEILLTHCAGKNTTQY